MNNLLLTTVAVLGIAGACLGSNAQCNMCEEDPDAARSRKCDGRAALEVPVEDFPAGTIRCATVEICNDQIESCCKRLVRDEIRNRSVNTLRGTKNFPCVRGRPCTYGMFSPGTGGKPGRSPYRENLACRGRMECRGRNIYYLMFNHDISPDINDIGQCRDFLDIKFMSYRDRPMETCGDFSSFMEKVPMFSSIEAEAIETHFHSNSVDDSSTGFYLFTVCFIPSLDPPPGLEPGESCFEPTPSGPEKRETDAYVEDIFDKIMERDSREKRSGVRFRSPKIKVPDGAKLSYENGVIRVSIGDKWLRKFEGIRVLQTFNMIEGYLTHYGSADGNFFGCGYLRVGDQIAHFVQMPVDFALFPTREETAIIATYLNVLYPSILLNIINSTDPDSISPVEPIFFPGIPALRDFPGFDGLPGFRPRGEPGQPGNGTPPPPPPDPQKFLDDFASTDLVKACNPVVRQVACDYLRDRRIPIPDPFCDT